MTGKFTRKMYDNCASDQDTRQSTNPLELLLDANKYVNCNKYCQTNPPSNNTSSQYVDVESSLWGIDRVSSNCDSAKYPFCSASGCLLTSDPRIPNHVTPYASEWGHDGEDALVTTNMKMPSNPGFQVPDSNVCGYQRNNQGQNYSQLTDLNLNDSQSPPNLNSDQSTVQGIASPSAPLQSYLPSSFDPSQSLNRPYQNTNIPRQNNGSPSPSPQQTPIDPSQIRSRIQQSPIANNGSQYLTSLRNQQSPVSNNSGQYLAPLRNQLSALPSRSPGSFAPINGNRPRKQLGVDFKNYSNRATVVNAPTLPIPSPQINSPISNGQVSRPNASNLLNNYNGQLMAANGQMINTNNTVTPNGTALNGLALNGMTPNGMHLNGMVLKGMAPNGNGIAPNGYSMASNGYSMAPNGNGMAPNGNGMVPNGNGMAPNGNGNGNGIAPNSYSMAPNGNGMVPNGNGMAPNGNGMVPNGNGMAPNGNGQLLGQSGLVVTQDGQLIGPNGRVLAPSAMTVSQRIQNAIQQIKSRNNSNGQ